MLPPPASTTAPRTIAFDNCVLDADARELRRDGAVVALQPKAFDVLLYLLGARDRVVTKEELLDHLWPNEAVTESSLTFSIKAVRRAVGDDGATQRVLKTVHGRGYRFVAEIRAAGAAPATVAAGTVARDRVLLQAASAQFVGRSEEFSRIREELALVRRGQTRTVFVLGDPGVGKTRLAAEIAALAEASGDTVLVGRCTEGSPPAFWPWVQVVRSFVEQHGREATRAAAGDGLADLARVVPGLVDPDEEARLLHSPGEGEATHARLRLFDSLVGFLRAASAAQPLVVVLDDLHWADASSLMVLRHVVREMLDSPLLVLGTYRHAEAPADGALAGLLAWLHRTRRSTRLPLHGLTDDEVALLMRELAGSEPPGELVTNIGRVTDGNPFFVEEFCRDLLDRGLFAPGEALALGSIRVPMEVREVLMQRASRLGASDRDVLATASVLGREFRLVDLVAAAEREESAVLRALEAAEATGLVHAEAGRPGTLVFAHALVREVLYEDLGSLRRAELHRRAGRVIESRAGGDPLLRASEMARHFGGAVALGDVAKAFACEVTAGDLCVERFAYEDGAAHYERALAFARSGACEDDARFELLLAMTRCAFRAGDEDRSRDLVAEAVEIARAKGSAPLFARAALRTATLFPVTPYERVALLEEALGGLRRSAQPDPRLLSRVLSALASGLYSEAGEADRREALVDEALALARASGDRRTLLRVLTAAQVALWQPEWLERRLALAGEHLAVAEQTGDPVEKASVRTWYVPALVESGRMAEADRQIDLIEREAADSRMLVYRANALSFRAMRALTRGAFDEVETLAQRSYELSRRYNETTASMTLWSQVYYVRREQGRLAEIAAGIHLFAAQVRHVSWDWLLLHLLVEDERPREAVRIVRRMVDSDFRECVPDSSHIVYTSALFGIAEAAWRLRDRDLAKFLLSRLEDFPQRWVTVGLGGVCLGSVSYILGLVLATLGRREEAVAALEQAERDHRDGDVPLPLLRTRAELGGLLLAGRSGEERRRGRAMLAEVVAESRRLGLVQIERIAGAAGG